MSSNVGKAIDIIGLAILVGLVLRYGQQASTLLATGAKGTAGLVTALKA